MMFLKVLVAWASFGVPCTDAAKAGTFSQIASFSIPKSPSGMFFDQSQGLLYILCGTQTNGDHYLYAFTTTGVQRCFITIPAASKMSRVDGFYIVGSTAYIVDSQGPMWSSSLGGSVYAVEWSNPCGCTSSGTCTSAVATWSPSVSKIWTLSASSPDISDGGGNDNYFRNSGIVVVGEYLYAVNGVHPLSGSLTSSYPKSLVKIKMADSSVAQKWSFTGQTLGQNVDMEGLTCGPDRCGTYIYIGDEYNYIYKLRLSSTDSVVAAVEEQWDINSVVGNVRADKGIESLTYASTTGYFYAGIQETAMVHVLQLTGNSSGSSAGSAASSSSSGDATSATQANSVASIVCAVLCLWVSMTR